MANQEVRVRFAPSPTGYLHVGGARTVFFNWLYAKHMGGKLILRVEDTDTARSTREHERMQIEDIKWLELDYAEGPDVGGPHAPYRQSERMDIYKKYADQLMANDQAYYCFCSDELLEQKREAAMKLGHYPQYDGTCRKISKDEAAARVAKGEGATVRFKAPARTYKLNDRVRGEVVFPENMVGDFVVLRTGGMPVYNFCCVIDDHLMDITHVIRAEEHLSNTVRQLMLYEAFGWTPPEFAHASLILGSDRSKLSKRHGATSVHQYAEEGYLKEALLNFILLLGWSHPEGKEIMEQADMIKHFDFDRINKSPSVFDSTKLKWMNGQYIRALPLETVFERALPFIEKSGLPVQGKDRNWLLKCFEITRGSLELLTDVNKTMAVFFDELYAFEADADALRKDGAARAVIEQLKAQVEKHVASKGDAISAEDFLAMQDAVKAATGQKGKGLFMPVRVALTGQCHGPELKLVVPVLGAKACLGRIEKALA